VLVALLVMPRKSPEVQAHLVIPGAAVTELPPARPQATRTVAAHVKQKSKHLPAQTVWMPAEPTVQIVIPADALLPPGALPDGINFVADLQLAANGSPASVALRP
jgi:hypothetical protein